MAVKKTNSSKSGKSKSGSKKSTVKRAVTKKTAGKRTTKKSIKKTTKPASGNSEAFVTVQQELEKKITSLYDANRQLKRKIFDLYTIFEISRNFNTVLEFEQLLDTFIFTSLAQVSASKAAIYLEKDRRESYYTLIKYRGSGNFPKPSQKFKDKSSLVDFFTRINRPTHIHELLNGIADKTETAILNNFTPGLAVPLLYQGSLTGILLLSDKISDREFNNDDIEFLSILGNQISVAIENTRLYEAEKKASQQLLQTQQQLVHSERLAALGEMSAKVAHEVNNPLGIIKNYLHLINSEVDSNANAKNYTKIVGEEINRIAQIVRELLDFYRPKGYEFQKIDIVDLLDSILSLMERQLSSRGIKLTRQFAKNCPLVDCSPDGMKQVFLNILINAYDAMKNGGSLEISITCLHNQIGIVFEDTGPGIPPEFIPRIFEPFFTTKEDGQGTGLGLSVCYGIIKKHNGSITFKNHDNGGRFEIKLPVKNKVKSI